MRRICAASRTLKRKEGREGATVSTRCLSLWSRRVGWVLKATRPGCSFRAWRSDTGEAPATGQIARNTFYTNVPPEFDSVGNPQHLNWSSLPVAVTLVANCD